MRTAWLKNSNKARIPPLGSRAIDLRSPVATNPVDECRVGVIPAVFGIVRKPAPTERPSAEKGGVLHRGLVKRLVGPGVALLHHGHGPIDVVDK
jgi:hypothetical protein